jgi:hypothetical protein
MQGKIFKTMAIAFGIVAIVFFALWSVLTILVTIYLIKRWNHPDVKGISNKDLIDYCKVSIFFGVIFFVSLQLRKKFLRRSKY